MKGPLIFLMFSALLLPVVISAQIVKEDVIYHRDGSIYRGTIISQISDSIYTIEIAGGSRVVINRMKIDSITKEKKLALIDWKVIDSISHDNWQKKRDDAFQFSLSYLTYFTSWKRVTHGIGITLLPEIKRRDKLFSFLPGIAVQYLPVTDLGFVVDSYHDGSIDRGYNIRIQIPVWFRITFGQKVQFFLQYGLSGGVSIIQGWGVDNSYGPHGMSGSTNHGWITYDTGFISPIMIGLGIKKMIRPGLVFVCYVEGSPVNCVINSEKPLHPYTQFHVGLNLGRKR